jgi:hypothetical protein
MSTTRVSAGFPAMFTNLVAEAAMKLPPLTKPEHFEFLKEILATTIESFWANYAASFPEDVRAQITDAVKNEDMDAVQKWHDTYANFGEDKAAAERAEKVLDEIAANLSSLLKDAYDEAFATP